MADSSVLASLAVRIAGETSDFEAAMKRAKNALGSFVQTANADLAKSFDQIDAQTKKLEKGFGRLGDSLQNAGRSMSLAITAPLLALGGASLKAFGEIDSLRRGLSTLEGTADKTEKRLKELRQVAKLPGLGFKEAIQGDIRLRSVGISADLSKRALLAFGNAIATVGGGRDELQRVTTQLAQLSAKGKVLAQDLRPIIEAAPVVATALKKMYGTVDSEAISKQLSKQGKNSTQFIDELVKELAKLPPVTGGIKNAFENLGDSSQLALAKIGEAINKNFNVEGKINALGDLLASLADGFSNLSPAAQGTIFSFAAFAAATGPVLFGIGAITKAIPTLIVGFTRLKLAITAAGGAYTLLAAGLATAVGLYLANKDAIHDLYKSAEELGDRQAVSALAAQLKSLQGDFNKTAIEARKAGADVNAALSELSQRNKEYFTPKLAEAQQKLNKYLAENGNWYNYLSRNLRTASEEGKAYQATVSKLSGEVQLYSGILKNLGAIQKNALSAKEAVVVPEEKIQVQIGLLERLRMELQKVTDAREVSGSEKEIAGYNRRITALDEEIKRLLELGKAQDKYFARLKEINTLRLSDGRTTTVEDGKVQGISAFDQQAAIQPVDPERFFSEDALKAIQDKFSRLKKTVSTEMEAINASISEAINGGIKEALTSLATLLGEAAAGAKIGAGQILASILDPLGNLLIKLGGIALGVAIGIQGIQASLASLNPGAALAAGIALIALGAAAKAGAAALAKPGAGGGSGGQRGGANPSASAKSVNGGGTIRLETVIRGSDLWLSNQRETDRRRRGG